MELASEVLPGRHPGDIIQQVAEERADAAARTKVMKTSELASLLEEHDEDEEPAALALPDGEQTQEMSATDRARMLLSEQPPGTIEQDAADLLEAEEAPGGEPPTPAEAGAPPALDSLLVIIHRGQPDAALAVLRAAPLSLPAAGLVRAAVHLALARQELERMPDGAGVAP